MNSNYEYLSLRKRYVSFTDRINSDGSDCLTMDDLLEFKEITFRIMQIHKDLRAKERYLLMYEMIEDMIQMNN